MEPDPNNQVPPVEQPMSQPLPDDDQAVFPAQPAPDIKKTFTPEPRDIYLEPVCLRAGRFYL